MYEYQTNLRNDDEIRVACFWMVLRRKNHIAFLKCVEKNKNENAMLP